MNLEFQKWRESLESLASKIRERPLEFKPSATPVEPTLNPRTLERLRENASVDFECFVERVCCVPFMRLWGAGYTDSELVEILDCCQELWNMLGMPPEEARAASRQLKGPRWLLCGLLSGEFGLLHIIFPEHFEEI